MMAWPRHFHRPFSSHLPLVLQSEMAGIITVLLVALRCIVAPARTLQGSSKGGGYRYSTLLTKQVTS